MPLDTLFKRATQESEKFLSRVGGGDPAQAQSVEVSYDPTAEKATGKRDEKDDTLIISKYEQEIDQEISNRSIYEEAWYTNIAFIGGYHYISWNQVTKKFEEPKAPSYRVRLVINKILPRYRFSISQMLRFNPNTVVTPNSSETIDEEGAQMGTKVIRGTLQKIDYDCIKLDKAEYQMAAGNAFVYFFWDPKLGTKIETGDDKEELYTGDVDVEVLSPWDVVPLDGALSIDKSKRFAIASYTFVDDIKAIHGDAAEDVKPDHNDGFVGSFLKKLENIIPGVPFTANFAQREDKKTLYYRVWERPSKKFPKGRFVAFAGKTLLQDTDVPNIDLGKEFEIPILHYKDISLPGRFWGQATIEQMIPLNKELNKTRSQVIESRNQMAKPKVVVVKGGISDTAWTTDPGEVVEWDYNICHGIPPHQVIPSSLPQYISELDRQLNADLADVGAMHEVSQAQVPSGVKSGRAIRELKESDETQASGLFSREMINHKILCTALLKMIQAHYSEERQLRVVGDNYRAEVISFNRAKLNGNNDVYVDSSDIIPQSRAAKQSFALDAYETGILGNKESDVTRKRALRMMETGNIDDLFDEGTDDAKLARWENTEKLSKGMFCRVEEWHYHAVHSIEHRKDMNSPMWEKLPPLVQAQYVYHLRWHEDMRQGNIPQYELDKIKEKKMGAMGMGQGVPGMEGGPGEAMPVAPIEEAPVPAEQVAQPEVPAIAG